VRRVERRLGRTGGTLSAGVWSRLSVRIPAGVRRAARRVLGSGGEAEAKVSVIATDQTGSETEAVLKVKLALP
jgi:hypothetical protein